MNPFEKFTRDFQGKRILIFGLGLLGRGVSVTRTFSEIGCSVRVTDRKTEAQLKPSLDMLKDLPISFRLGEHQEKDVKWAQVIIRNPDVVWHHPLLQKARKLNIPIYMDTSLFAKYFLGLLIGITGTRGKTTTTQLIFNILRGLEKYPVFLGGNATPKANIALLKKTNKKSIVVAELSSWELQGFRELLKSPQISVITNIYKDHLDHYRSFKEYVSDKQEIFLHQSSKDYIILNRHNSLTKKMEKKARSKVIWFSAEDVPSNWKLHLLGNHNLENVAAAMKVAEIRGFSKDQLKKIIESFPGVPHRLEVFAEKNSVTFVDDTTSTIPDATIKAIQAIKRPIILLVGGNSKHIPIGRMAKEINKRTKAIVLLKGNGTQELEKELSKLGNVNILANKRSFHQSVKVAIRNTDPGDVVLLSPGFTSYAEFNNIIERGNRFQEIVREYLEID